MSSVSLKPGEYLFTSESVSEGHPDKLADRISDSVLDNLLAQDKNSRVACETFVKTGMVLIGGEISTQGWINFDEVARQCLREVGYDAETGFDAETIAVLTNISRQSSDIAQGVDRTSEEDQGAGDQGIMFGYACNETPELMPAAINFAHRIVKELSRARHQKIVDYLLPDAKSQVTLRYSSTNPSVPQLHTVVVSTQHTKKASSEAGRKELQAFIQNEVVNRVIPEVYREEHPYIIHVNPTGKFEIGGPVADAGLTGRKIIVDTYGGAARHGGGAFSGKDPSKVDRSAAYAARYLAKNVVAAGLADRCEIQISYAIGVAKPVSIFVDTFGTGKVPNEKIVAAIDKSFDLRPRAITKNLDLLRPIYVPTTAYGHFGREPGADGSFSWERTDLVDKLKSFV